MAPIYPTSGDQTDFIGWWRPIRSPKASRRYPNEEMARGIYILPRIDGYRCLQAALWPSPIVSPEHWGWKGELRSGCGNIAAHRTFDLSRPPSTSACTGHETKPNVAVGKLLPVHRCHASILSGRGRRAGKIQLGNLWWRRTAVELFVPCHVTGSHDSSLRALPPSAASASSRYGVRNFGVVVRSLQCFAQEDWIKTWSI